MIPEKMFQQILALGEAWRVARMDYQEKEQRVLIRVEATPASWKQESCPQCGETSRRHFGPLAARADDGLLGRTQQFVLGDQTQGQRLSFHGVSDRHALLRRRQTRNPLLCLTTHYKRRGTKQYQGGYVFLHSFGKIWIVVAGPKFAGCVQERSAQTTFLPGVTSIA